MAATRKVHFLDITLMYLEMNTPDEDTFNRFARLTRQQKVLKDVTPDQQRHLSSFAHAIATWFLCSTYGEFLDQPIIDRLAAHVDIPAVDDLEAFAKVTLQQHFLRYPVLMTVTDGAIGPMLGLSDDPIPKLTNKDFYEWSQEPEAIRLCKQCGAPMTINRNAELCSITCRVAFNKAEKQEKNKA